MRRTLRWVGLGLVVLLVVIQLVPYGRDHTNPPVSAEPAWDSPRTRELAERACFACHGNTTTWPWYSNVAPISWYVQHDVEEGRRKLNFSAWDRPQHEAGEAVEVVQAGAMPPPAYTWLHAEAQLSAQERNELIRGLMATLGTPPAAD
jgi:mono/diheme cytochrome c family protein